MPAPIAINATASLRINPAFATPDFLKCLLSPAMLLTPAAEQLTVDRPGRQTAVFRVTRTEFAGQSLIVKRYRPDFWLALKEFFRLSRAQRAFGIAEQLQKLNIPTATPVAAVDVRKFGWLRECYFIALEVPRAEWLRGVRGRTQSPLYSRRLIRNFAVLMARLHDAGFRHADPTLSNFLVTHDAPDQPRLVVIDLDALRPARRTGLDAAVQDFPQLLRRIPMSPREQLCFLAQYVRARTAPEHGCVVLDQPQHVEKTGRVPTISAPTCCDAAPAGLRHSQAPSARELAFRLGILAGKS